MSFTRLSNQKNDKRVSIGRNKIVGLNRHGVAFGVSEANLNCIFMKPPKIDHHILTKGVIFNGNNTKTKIHYTLIFEKAI